MLTFAERVSLSAGTDGRVSKRGHKHEFDVALLQDLVIEYGPHPYE
jgi:hypothetical protein